MKAHNGLITLEDLKNYKAKERSLLRGIYRGYEVITMPPQAGRDRDAPGAEYA